MLSSLTALSQRVDQCSALVGIQSSTGDVKANSIAITERIRRLEEHISSLPTLEVRKELMALRSNEISTSRGMEDLPLPLTTFNEEVPRVSETMKLEPLVLQAVGHLEEVRKYMPILDSHNISGADAFLNVLSTYPLHIKKFSFIFILILDSI